VVAVLLLDHRQRLVRDHLRLLDKKKLGFKKPKKADKGGYYPRVSDPDSIRYGKWIRTVFGIQIRIQEGKNDPQKKENIKKISCFEVLDVLF
jgi:hypothetical protein